ncbi:hypothetical protein J5N97_021751 [Dioscorea zingiberensis]|uniref:Glutamate receptor n=1 Tax=Dioscorea zingiberensis TaxID=325984 RepID=A0A9D5C9R3_9LILI|nr:hypothetical protein J5N97_021751 [Dioscorea zingiberensis]
METAKFVLLILCFCFFSSGISTRPTVVKIGAIFSFNSTIGRVAKVAIDAAVDDINNDSSLLPGTNLLIQMQDSRCNGFTSIIQTIQFMKTEIAAVIGPQSSVNAHVLSHFANELQVPFLSFSATDPTLSSLQFPFLVRTTYSDLFQMSAIARMVHYYKWRKVVAIYSDDDYGRNGIAALGDMLEERLCRISYKAALSPGATRTDITNMLVRIPLMESSIIVVHVNQDLGLTIFSTAHHLQMMSKGYVWIATDWLSSFIDSSVPVEMEIMNSMQGVLTFRQHTLKSEKHGLVSRWRELTKHRNNEVLQLNSYGLHAYDNVWLIARALEAFFRDNGTISFSKDLSLHSFSLEAMTKFNEGQSLLNKMKTTEFDGVSGKIQFDSDGNLIHPAYDILNVFGSGMRTVGFWSNTSGLSTTSLETIYTNMTSNSSENQNLYTVIWPGQTMILPRGWLFPQNGKELRIGVPNRVILTEFVSKDPDTGKMRGYCIDVFTAAIDLLPYAVPYKLIPFGDGIQNPNYTDLVQKVASNVFDAAVGDITIETNRTKLVDFTQPYIQSGLVIMAHTKKFQSYAWAFLQPFTVEMWCTTGAFLIFVGTVVWLLEHRVNDDFRGPPKKQCATLVWFSFSTLFFAHREKTVGTLGRAVLLIWLFVVLIIQSSYTASLTSILTVRQLFSPITGIQGLIASNEPIGVQVGSFADKYLVQELGIQKSRIKVLSSTVALEFGPHKGGVAAIIDERPYLEFFLKAHCQFSTIGSQFTNSGWGFAFPKDSPLTADISKAIIKLSENGDLQRIHDKWLTRKGCSSENKEMDSNQLQVSSFCGLFLLCGMACFIALLIHFSIITIQFIRHYTPNDSIAARNTISRRSFQDFLSFFDEKDESVKSRSKRLELQNGGSNSDNELSIPGEK